MKRPPFLLYPCAAFAAGLAAALLWPPAPDPSSSRIHGRLSDPSPLTGQVAAGSPPGASRLARLSAGRDRAAGMTGAEARAALLALPRPPSRADREWWSTLLTRWTEEEPGEALAWLKRENGRVPLAYDLVFPALAAAARRDLGLALITAQEWRSWDSRDLFRAAAGVDPRAAVEFAAGKGTAAAQGLAAAFSEWMRADSAAALAWLRGRGKAGIVQVARQVMDDLRTLPPGELEKILSALPAAERERMREQKANFDGRADPVAMLARLPELKDSERQGAVHGTVIGLLRLGDAANLGRLLASLSGKERERAGEALSDIISIPPEAVKAITGLTELTVRERLRLFSESSRNMGPEEFLTGLKDLGAASGAEKREVEDTVRGKWSGWLGAGSPENFAAFGRLLGEGKVPAELPLELMGTFCHERNTEAARKLIGSLPEDRRAVPLALHTAFLSLQDPAVDPVPLLTDPALRAEDRKRIFAALLQPGYNAAPDQAARELAFLDRLPGSVKAEALLPLLQKNPDDITAYESVFRELAAGGAGAWTQELTDCLYELTRRDARRDPAAGFARAESAPEGPVRENLERSVFRQVLEEQAVAASEWLARQPEGRRRDEMTRDLVHHISGSDPASAWQWAASIRTDPEMRRQLQEKVLPLWRAADPAAAAAAAEAAGAGKP